MLFGYAIENALKGLIAQKLVEAGETVRRRMGKAGAMGSGLPCLPCSGVGSCAIRILRLQPGEITMSSTTRAVVVAALTAIGAVAAFGSEPLQAQTYSNNPYRPVPWPKPWQPDGLNGSIDFGPTTGIYADPNTDHIWLATRCGRTPRYHTNQEGCVFKPDYDPAFKVDERAIPQTAALVALAAGEGMG